MRKLVFLAIAAVVAMLVGGGTSSATESTSTASPGPGSSKFCAALVGGADASGTSHVLIEKCSPISRADAVDAMRAEAARRGMAPVVETPLVILYEDINYRGHSEVFYGTEGPCDRSGYKITLRIGWSAYVSSIERIGSCDRARLTNPTDTDTFTLSTPGIGRFNDNVRTMQVYSSYWPPSS